MAAGTSVTTSRPVRPRGCPSTSTGSGRATSISTRRPARCGRRGEGRACRSGAGGASRAGPGGRSVYTWTSAQPSPGWPRGTRSVPRRNWPFATTTVVARPLNHARPSTRDRDVRRGGGPPQPIRRRPEHHHVDGIDGVDGAVVRIDREGVDRDLGGASAVGPTAQRAGEVGPSGDGRYRTSAPGPPRHDGDEHRRRRLATTTSGGPEAASSPRLAGAQRTRHRPTSLDAAIDAAEAGVGCRRARRPQFPAASARRSPIWRRRSTHCLTWRTKSPPVMLVVLGEHVGEVLARRPLVQRIGRTPGRARGSPGSPASSSLWLRSCAMRSIAGTVARPRLVGHLRGGSGPAPSGPRRS